MQTGRGGATTIDLMMLIILKTISEIEFVPHILDLDEWLDGQCVKKPRFIGKNR